MESENPATPAEVSAPPVQANHPPASAPVPAPPPATETVASGVVKSEREIELQKNLDAAMKRTRELETKVAERERDLQNALPAAPAPVAEKVRKKYRWSDPVFNEE